MMLNSHSLNHAKVLLHLKWFISRLANSFEHKLHAAVSSYCLHASDHYLPGSQRNSESSIWSHSSSGKSPLTVLGGKLKNRSLSTDGEQLPLSSKTPEFKCEIYRRGKMSSRFSNPNRSPKVRSLTASPFLTRLSFSRILSTRRIPLSEYSDSNSDLGRTSTSASPGLHFADFSDIPPSGFDVKDPTFSQLHDVEIFRILLFIRSTTESERKFSISRYAQHLCVVYEYQIGFLQGLKAVHYAADYIAEVLIKSIRIGRITSLSPDELTLQLLYDSSCKPPSQNKCIKTSPVTGTGEQLSWRLGEIWTRPGLRHNEVGGENCHNLNIVTHFLAPYSAGLEIRRPDIYGYRNIILLPSKDSTVLPPDGVYENTNLNDAMIYANGNNGVGSGSESYDIFHPDEETISASNIRTGSRIPAPLSKVQKLEAVTNPQIQSSDIIIPHQSIKAKFPPLSTVMNLRQHLHRAYRPLFFVIYERPSVIDHLVECESFAAFCKRQHICPIMFLNQETDLFEGRICTSLFQHFDIFSLTSNSFMSKSLSSESSGRPVNQRSSHEDSRLRRSTDMCLGGIDNPGFVS